MKRFLADRIIWVFLVLPFLATVCWAVEGKRMPQLDELTSLDTNDLFVIFDSSADETKKMYPGSLKIYHAITPSANVQSLLAAADYAAMKVLLDLEIDTDVQAYDADLTTYAGITPSADVQGLLGAATYAAMKGLLDLEIGTDIQAYDADLTTYAGITPSANVQSLLAAADYAAMKVLLDLEIDTDVQAYSTALQSIAGLTEADVSIIESTADNAYGVVTSGGNNYILGSNSDNSALEFKTPANVLSEIGGQPLDGTLTSIAGGVIGENLDNTAHPWADDEMANDPTLDLLKMSALTSAPGSPAAGRIYYADNDTWDPCDIAGTNNYYCIYDGAAYKAIVDEDGRILLSSIELPTLKASELNDTSDPHLLTTVELLNKTITNSESTGADEWDFPALSEGWNLIFIKEVDQDVTLDPNGSENWWFRTDNSAYTQNGAGTSIINTTAGRSTITIFSTETGVYCSGDANWEQGS